MDFVAADAFAKDEAERIAETQVMESIEENLPPDEEADWNWEALAKMANSRWGLHLRDRDLKKIGRNEVDTVLTEKARAAIAETDLSEGSVFLEEDYGLKSACGWVRHKFGIDMDPAELRELEPAEIIAAAQQRAVETYQEKEAEYAVMAGIYRFSSGAPGQARVDRQQLIDWARDRFDADLSFDDVKNRPREEIRNLLLQYSRKHRRNAEQAAQEVRDKIESLFGEENEHQPLQQANEGNGAVASLASWLEQSLNLHVSPEELGSLDRDQLEEKLLGAIDKFYRPEMRRMERSIVLQIVDSAWKDHLLSMDHLRSSVGLVGYAQVDPKVEYKREGMKLFDQMWNSIGQRTTDLVFRMELLDEAFVGSTWVETAAVHEQGPTASEIAQQEQAVANNQEQKVETIRNVGQRVGRNEPCPCGSGKKYKNCCMRHKVGAA
jgi:preprotein translocase subunit SecA